MKARAAGPGTRTALPVAAFDVLNLLGSAWIVVLMFAICLDVVGRTALSRPIDGIAELSALSIVCIVFLQLPAAVAGRRLTRADALLGKLSQSWPAAARAIEGFWTLLGMAVFGAVSYSAAKPAMRAWQRGDFIGVEGIFTFPAWIVWALIVLGSVLSALAYGLRIWIKPATESELGHV